MKEAPDSSDVALQQILNAASTVFAESGFGGARVDEIAHRAGVNKAMLYYHVGGKKALYEQVLSRNFRILGKAMDEAGSGANNAVDHLRRMIGAILSTLKTIPDHPRLMLHEVATQGRTLPRPVLEQMVSIFRRVQTILLEGQRQGQFRSVDALLTHVSIIGGVVFLLASRPLARHFLSTLHEKTPSPVDDTDLAEHLSRLILQGIATQPEWRGSKSAITQSALKTPQQRRSRNAQ